MTSHNVIVAGTIAAHTSRESAIAALTQRFKLDAARAAALLGGTPTVVKKGVDEASAQQFCSALQAIGVDAYVQRLEAAAAAPPPPPASPPPPSSPAAMSPPPPAARAPTSPRGWRFELQGQPDYAFLSAQVPAGETIKVEASAMATMDTHLVMKTKLRGGLSRFLTGESIFINEFTADGGPGEIGVAPGAPGDMRHLYLDDETVYLQNSAYVASNVAVAVESKWQGLTKGFFSGESLFLIRCSGRGDLWFSSYGGIIEIDVDGDYVVDTGNIVAFTEGLTYKVSKVGGYKSLFFSGEGFVCRFSGKGTVWVQTRKVGALASWVWPFRPTK
jgi:uncharacterized protein (TIGR00266 family)